MPDAPEPNERGEAEPKFELVDDGSRAVGFVDAPDLDVGELIGVIIEAFSALADDAVLTVYNNVAVGLDIADRGAKHGIELVHAVPHADGTTFVLRRSNR